MGGWRHLSSAAGKRAITKRRAGRLDDDTFYDKVYDAERPELFFKSTAARTVGPGAARMHAQRFEVAGAGSRSWGSCWTATAAIVGYTVGNDMSCRDIEGENPLYLPQAKIWRRSCSIGPCVRLAETVEDPYELAIACRIYRGGGRSSKKTANTGQLKRKLEELVVVLKAGQ